MIKLIRRGTKRSNSRSHASPCVTRCDRRQLVGVEPLEPRLVLDSTVVFNELMYNPAGTDETLEWIEFHNQMAVNMDLSEWSVTGGVEYDFPSNLTVPAGEYIVLARDPSSFAAATGVVSALGVCVVVSVAFDGAALSSPQPVAAMTAASSR